MDVRSDTTTGGFNREFPATQWSVLLSLRDPKHPSYHPVMNYLIKQYWKPVYYYVRALRKVTVEDAKDLTQHFFTMLLSRKDFEKLSPARGSFRGFIKTALKHFLVDQDRSGVKRDPKDGAKLLQFSDVEWEWNEVAPRVNGLSPDEVFDQKWARDVVARAVQKLEQVLGKDGKSIYFDLFRKYYLEPSGIVHHGSQSPANAEPPSYATLAKQYQLKDDDVKNHLRYTRQRMREILKHIVTEYMTPDENVEAELEFILSR